MLECCNSCLESGKPNKFCPNISNCHYFKEYFANTVINKYSDFDEIIVYKTKFQCKPLSKISNNGDRSRKWFLTKNNILIAKNDDTTMQDYIMNKKDSRERALETFYGYALSNNWQWFVTLTFDEKMVDRNSVDSVNHCWSLFLKYLKRIFPDVMAILVIEPHVKGGYHFHGLLGNCENLLSFCFRAYNKNIDSKFFGDELNTSFGNPIYNFNENVFPYGFTTVVPVRTDKIDNRKVVEYLQKYMSKDNNCVDYNSKVFYHTQNLQFKTKQCLNLDDEELGKLLSLGNVKIKKENDEFSVYELNHK